MVRSKHGEAWRGNWPVRLYLELNRRGFGTLLAFADSVGCTTYSDMAEALEGDFAPIQMMYALRNEFAERDDARGFAADCLYRYLHDHMRPPAKGPPAKGLERRKFLAATAFGSWAAALGRSSDETRLVARLLFDRVVEGWLPTGPDDLLLIGVMAAQRWRIESDDDN